MAKNNIVLYEPEIPQNTGNIMRTCAGTDTVLHLIEPLGFKMDEKHLVRAAVNYVPNVDFIIYKNWEDFLEKNPNGKKYFLLSDYNNEGKRVSHWFVDGVETYHRNMGHLVNGLIDAGFRLEKMIESYVTEDIIEKNPKFVEQLDHSYYVYFKAKK